MDIKLLQKNRFLIILDALLKGIIIEYKNSKSLFYYQKCIYETFYAKSSGRQITRKSEVSFQDFLNQFNKIDNKKLKRIYGDIQLFKLAKKLINGRKSSTL